MTTFRKTLPLLLLCLFFFFPSYALAGESEALLSYDLLESENNPYLSDFQEDSFYQESTEANLDVLADDVASLDCSLPGSEDSLLLDPLGAGEQDQLLTDLTLTLEDENVAADAATGLLEETTDSNLVTEASLREEAENCLFLQEEAIALAAREEAGDILKDREAYGDTFFAAELTALRAFLAGESKSIEEDTAKEKEEIEKIYQESLAFLADLRGQKKISAARYERKGELFRSDYEKALRFLALERKDSLESLEEIIKEKITAVAKGQERYNSFISNDYEKMTADSSNIASVATHEEALAFESDLIDFSGAIEEDLSHALSDRAFTRENLDPSLLSLLESDAADLVEDRCRTGGSQGCFEREERLKDLEERARGQRARDQANADQFARNQGGGNRGNGNRNNNPGGNPGGNPGSGSSGGSVGAPVYTSYAPVASAAVSQAKSAKEIRQERAKKARKQAKKALASLDARLGSMKNSKFSAWLKKEKLLPGAKALVQARRAAARLQYEKAAYLKLEQEDVKVTKQIYTIKKQTAGNEAKLEAIDKALVGISDKVENLKKVQSEKAGACRTAGDECDALAKAGVDISLSDAQISRLEREKEGRGKALGTLEEQLPVLEKKKAALDAKLEKRFASLRDKGLEPLKKLSGDKKRWKKINKSDGNSFHKGVKKIYSKTKSKYTLFVRTRSQCKVAECTKETAPVFYVNSKAQPFAKIEQENLVPAPLPKPVVPEIPSTATTTIENSESEEIKAADNYAKQQEAKQKQLKKDKKGKGNKKGKKGKKTVNGTKKIPAEDVFNTPPALKKDEVVAGIGNPYGSNAEAESNPSAVALRTGKTLCSGVIVHPRWILTAAHCVYSDPKNKTPYSTSEIKAVIGQSNVFKPQYSEVTEVIAHPDYTWSAKEYDIALLKLKEKTESPAMKITDPAGEDFFQGGVKATVSGWGIPCKGCKPNSTISLRTVTITEQKICQTAFRGSKPAMNITDNMICAKAIGRDACTGDSGGPLSISVDGREELLGTVSFGVGCNNKKYPGVYTYLPNMTGWISEAINAGIKAPGEITIKKARKNNKSKTIRIKNKTLLPVAIEKISLSNKNTFSILKNECGKEIPGGKSCLLTLLYRGEGKSDKTTLTVAGKRGTLLETEVIASNVQYKK